MRKHVKARTQRRGNTSRDLHEQPLSYQEIKSLQIKALRQAMGKSKKKTEEAKESQPSPPERPAFRPQRKKGVPASGANPDSKFQRSLRSYADNSHGPEWYRKQDLVFLRHMASIHPEKYTGADVDILKIIKRALGNTEIE